MQQLTDILSALLSRVNAIFDWFTAMSLGQRSPGFLRFKVEYVQDIRLAEISAVLADVLYVNGFGSDEERGWSARPQFNERSPIIYTNSTLMHGTLFLKPNGPDQSYSQI